MLGSDILEVAIGLALVFALVSTICMAVREGLESFLKTRASFLEYGIRQLLNDPRGQGIVRSLFDHPLVSGLYPGTYTAPKEQGGTEAQPPARSLSPSSSNLPSYIPGRNFAKALIDIIARGPADSATVESSSQPISLAQLRGNLAHIDNPQLQRALLSALDSAEGDIERLRTNIEAWYDSAMERVSGWYKRTTQKMVFVIALVVTVAMNVNTFAIANYLILHDAERQVLVAQVEASSAAGTLKPLTSEDAQKRLEEMALPIGWQQTTAVWNQSDGPQAIVVGILMTLLGWLITAFAATLGAPFWFDVLSKFMTVRSTLKPREAEKKKDGGAEAAPAPAGAGTVPAASAASAASAAASAEAHVIDDSCGVGTSTPPTRDDELPAATGGVA